MSFRRHPWEVARWRFFRRILRDSGALSTRHDVLDVGAGDAWFLTQLMRLVREEPDEAFDLLVLLDVLEHVEHDRDFLRRRVDRNLRSGGVVLVSVPAWSRLYTAHDVALGHHRRYAPPELLALLEGAGLTVRTCGGLFHTLTLPRAARKALEVVLGRRDAHGPEGLEWRGGRLLTLGVEAALAFDNAASRLFARHGWNVPGLSFWALCDGPSAAKASVS